MVINPKVSTTFEGLSHIALGPSLQNRFELRDMLKIVVSCIVRFIYFIFPRNFLVGSLKAVKTEVGFFVLLLTSLYYYYENPSKQGETGEKGYRSTLRLIYFEAFALMSLSLSTQAQPGCKLDSSNFLLPCMVLAIIKQNFMVGVGVAVICYVAMNSRSYSDSRRPKQRRRSGGEQDDGAVVGDGLLSPLIHPFSSLSTLRRGRSVSLESFSLGRAGQKLVVTGHKPYRNLEWLVFLNTPSPIVIRHISFKTLNNVSLSATEYSTLSASEWDFFIKALRHLLHQVDKVLLLEELFGTKSPAPAPKASKSLETKSTSSDAGSAASSPSVSSEITNGANGRNYLDMGSMVGLALICMELKRDKENTGKKIT